MPIIKRTETDFFRLEPIVDVLVNPTNTMGAMGAGLALVFRERYPDMYRQYRQAYERGELAIGKLLIYPMPQRGQEIVNLPTKQHWADPTELDYVAKGLSKLRDYLQAEPHRRLWHVAMPMLGCGKGGRDYSEVEPLMVHYLDDLPNLVHLCMMPDRAPHPFRYLAIIGSRSITDGAWVTEPNGERVWVPDPASMALVERCVFQALKEWGLTLADFDAIVSGAGAGIDTVAAGKTREQDSFAKRHHPTPPIIIEADWARFGKSAGFRRNAPVADVLTHCVAIMDKPNSVGTRMTIQMVNRLNEKLPVEQRKRVREFYTYELPEHGTLCDPSLIKAS